MTGLINSWYASPRGARLHFTGGPLMQLHERCPVLLQGWLVIDRVGRWRDIAEQSAVRDRLLDARARASATLKGTRRTRRLVRKRQRSAVMHWQGIDDALWFTRRFIARPAVPPHTPWRWSCDGVDPWHDEPLTMPLRWSPP